MEHHLFDWHDTDVGSPDLHLVSEVQNRLRDLTNQHNEYHTEAERLGWDHPNAHTHER